ncbi:MAG: histidinol-phosphate transaminase [Candidatus Omnitrophica bacterium]|nr:histidinol-phosphate transaminase [Candidatus Omnitrophota bacterium]
MVSARRSLKNLKAYKPGKPVEELKRELDLKEVYKLASNEIPFVPAYIFKAVLSQIPQINRYPEASSHYVRQKLARTLKVKPDRLVFGNGSDELIVMTLRAFVEERDEVIIGTPTFLIYEIQSQVAGARIKKVPLRDYRYDLETIARAITKKTKMIFIANPDNPHGTYVTHEEVVKFLNKVPKNVLVFFDEAYFEFVMNKDYPRTLALLKTRKNIIMSRTFSKAYGLAGVRIGYAVCDPEVAQCLNNVREPFNIDRFAQACASAALDNYRFVEKVKNHIVKEKRYLYRELAKLNLEYIESVTNFILINFKKDTARLNEYLLRKGIIVRPLAEWGLPEFFRVTVGLHKENEAFIRHLKGFLKNK